MASLMNSLGVRRNNRKRTVSVRIATSDELSSASTIHLQRQTDEAKQHGQQLKSSSSYGISSKMSKLFDKAGLAGTKDSTAPAAPISQPFPLHSYQEPTNVRMGLGFEEDKPEALAEEDKPNYSLTSFQIIEKRDILTRSANIDLRDLLGYLRRIHHVYIGGWLEDYETSWQFFHLEPLVKPQLIRKLADTKSKFDTLYERNPAAYRLARNEMNPYEKIGRACFINRAAVKMANMDFAYSILRPYLRGHPADRRYLFFADLCAAPGGFSEYILWKCGGRARGYGFSLKHDRDQWRIKDFNVIARTRAETRALQLLYGKDEVMKADRVEYLHRIKERGSGDITNADNINHFTGLIVKRSNGVDVVVADGGSDVSDGWNLQEMLMKGLVLGQILSMFKILRNGGTFVLKVFDIFTPFTVSLLYYLYVSFRKFSIFKPVTSRPANSERYIICQGLALGGSDVQIHKLSEEPRIQIVSWLEEALNALKNHDYERKRQNQDRVTHGGPDLRSLLDPHKCEDEFMKYISDTATEHVVNQIASLNDVYSRLVHKVDPPKEHETIAESCYELWNVPHNREDVHSLVDLQWGVSDMSAASVVSRPPPKSLPMAMRMGVDAENKKIPSLGERVQMFDPELAALL
ncbi:hypothetical protein GEMRC1_011201 [Eukaryota sp. GEM-RC1]